MEELAKIMLPEFKYMGKVKKNLGKISGVRNIFFVRIIIFYIFAVVKNMREIVLSCPREVSTGLREHSFY